MKAPRARRGGRMPARFCPAAGTTRGKTMNRTATLQLAAAAALALVGKPGFAQEAPPPAQDEEEAQGTPEILVVGHLAPSLMLPNATGSRLGFSPLETPASLATIDGDEARARGDRTIVEAVTRAPGVTSTANPGNGNTALAARGFSGQGSVLQLVDGVRLFPVAGTITFPTDPWMVERIEVLSGPASVLYGQGALGGAVNVITRRPNSERLEAQAEIGYGSQDSWRVAAGADGPLGGDFAFRADASYRRSDGFVDRGDSRSLALAGALRFAPNDALSVTLRHDFGEVRPSRYFGTPLVDGRLDTSLRGENYNVADAFIEFRDNRTTLAIDWSPTPALTISNIAYRLSSHRQWRNLESYCWIGADGACPNGYGGGTSGHIYRTDNLGIVHDQVQYGDQASARLSTPLGGDFHNDLVIGFDANLIKLTYSHNFGSDLQEDEVAPTGFDPGLLLDTQGIAPRYRTRTTEWSLFAEDRLSLGEQISLVAGLRYERDRVERSNITYDVAGNPVLSPAFPNGTEARRLSNTTWRLGAVYQPIPTVSLYAQYVTGVDPLGTLTTYTTSASQFFFTNATGHQVEAGVKASFLGGRGAATLAVYRIVKNNLVAQRTPTSPVEQIGRRSAEGIEASVALDLPAGFSVEANGMVLDADYDDFISGGTSYTGNTPPNVAETAGNLWLRWTASRLQVRAGLRYVGRRFSDDANQFRLPAYTVVDASVAYALTDTLGLELYLDNLFDRDYAVASYNDEQWLLGRPRSIDVALRARF
jgi:iron complex outermembrane receptor protein